MSRLVTNPQTGVTSRVFDGTAAEGVLGENVGTPYIVPEGLVVTVPLGTQGVFRFEPIINGTVILAGDLVAA